jgi:uncharacterized LabA/DUF88 family protein
MEKAVLFLDFANIDRAAVSKGISMDYGDLLNYMGEGRFLIDAYCYMPIDPRNEHGMDRLARQLWRDGYMVTTKTGVISGDTYKCNFDVEMTMDIIEIAHRVKPDIVVLATGDVDFLPVVLQLRKSGIRVEVAAFTWSVSSHLLLRCSDYIDLGIYHEERSRPLLEEGTALDSDLEAVTVSEPDENENPRA